MTLCFTNTLSREKEELKPLKEGEISLYVCGITVYGETHIGHARGAVVFDVLRRFLEAQGFRVEHVRNITDIDDKIIDRARREPGLDGDLNARVREIARRFTDRFQADFGKLGLLKPNREPKATEFIPKMVEFIQNLVDRGIAYEAADGVYFSVRKLPEYGRLSHQNPDQMLENHRVETGDRKKDPLDFALWKKAKPEEPNWPSPWGSGRPGWHIECSTMSTGILGDTFDIHGGGQDLIFPHHENELAQALGAGKPFAKIWLHNGLLTLNGQKMAKSLGNFVTVEDVLKQYPADVLRLFFLSAHYRSPIDFTWERMEESKHSYETIISFLAHANALGSGESKIQDKDLGIIQKFHDVLDDDLNTPQALACLHILIDHANKELQTTARSEVILGKKDQKSIEAETHVRGIRDKVRELLMLLGFQLEIKESFPAQVELLLEEREKFRREKQYAAADHVRSRLLELGYLIEDTPDGVIVRRKL